MVPKVTGAVVRVDVICFVASHSKVKSSWLISSEVSACLRPLMMLPPYVSSSLSFAYLPLNGCHDDHS